MLLALNNVIRYGDTDIFPFPIERQVMRDEPDETLKILLHIDKSFENSMHDMPVESERMLQAVGYTGFRQGTQIDPIWNTYLLGTIIFLGEDIENARVPVSKGVIFSYRFGIDPSDHSVFSKDHGWLAFQKRSVELAKQHKYVLTCDISDFYPRIYHHRLENALKKATKNTQAIIRIKRILADLSRGASYGLPVGGPAARLLSELLLNRVDRLLLSRGCPFCRFVDDYHVFAQTQEEAYSRLVYLCESLLENEGLSLQKTKTRIMSAAEFLETSVFTTEEVEQDEEESARRDFMTLHIHYDPYSDTAAEDYETLKGELAKFDIVGMLAVEMNKPRISESLTRKLVRAVKHLTHQSRDTAVLSLIENLPTLYPIFPTVMMVIRDVLADLSPQTRGRIFIELRRLIDTGSYLCAVPVNLAFALRVLYADNSEETDTTLIKVYSSTASSMIKRDIILILAAHNTDYWVSAQLKRYSSCTLWEKRALLVASYILEDEGEHWRRRVKGSFSPFDTLVSHWAGKRKQAGLSLEL
jgi:predicted RNA-binding protein YlxR (DUF448 family)